MNRASLRIAPSPLSRLALLSVLLFVGCQSIRVADEPEPVDDPMDRIIEISDSDRARARALAAFAQGQIHELNRQTEWAVTAYERALLEDPTATNIAYRLAMLLVRMGEAERAIEVVHSLTERYPADPQAWLWLGTVYRQQNELEKAARAFETARGLEPTEAAIYVFLVELMLQDDRNREAVDLLRVGTEKVDEPTQLYRLLGELNLRRAFMEDDEQQQEALLEEAILALEIVRESEPNDASVWSMLGDIYLRQGDADRALEYMEQAAQLDRTDIALRERLVYLYELEGRPQDAIRTLESLTLLQPTNARLFFALASLHEQLDQLDQAIVNYRLASRLGRPNPAAYLKLAVLQMEDAPQAALEDLRTGLELIPGNPRMLEMLGYVLFSEEEYAAAAEAFREAEREWIAEDEGLDAMTPNFYLYLALSYYFNDQTEYVPDLLGRAIEQNPVALEAFTHFIFEDDDKERRAEVAVQIFEALLKTDDENIILWITLGYVHSFHERYAEARDAFDQAYQLTSELDEEQVDDEWLNARFFFWYAAANERTEYYERAEKLFYRSLDLQPDNPDVYNYLAYMWAELGINLEQAEEYVAIALKARPDSAAFIDTLGWIYYKQGRYEEAYVEIRRAADIIPDDPVILDHLGDIYYALEKFDSAKENWLRAFTLDPENEDLEEKLVDHDLLAKAQEKLGDSETEQAESETEPDDEHEEDRTVDDNPVP